MSTAVGAGKEGAGQGQEGPLPWTRLSVTSWIPRRRRVPFSACAHLGRPRALTDTMEWLTSRKFRI